MRLWPRSLLGQTLLAVAIALLVAQAVSAVLLFRGTENRREAAVFNAATINLLVDPERRIRRMERAMARMADGGDLARLRERPIRPRMSDTNPLLDGEANMPVRAGKLRELLSAQGVDPANLVVTIRRAGDDPVLQRRAERNPRFAREPGWADRTLLVAGMQRAEGGTWQVARVPIPARETRVIGGIIAQTLVLFAILLGVLYVALRRITRPLAALTKRTVQFARTQDASDPLPPAGPHDISQLIAAHNAMESRITAMLDEKDVMLGAIGHDLKTPLAALRVRIESVEDDGQRAKMAASIEDITRSLDDILALARIGRAQADAEAAQLGALAEAVVEEFEDMGQPVTLTQSERIVLPVHVTWLRRALRNLIANAVRYAGAAEVALLRDGSAVILRVDDQGPGIPAARIDAMLEPFQRGEASRNRATGGAGLGLTLARAIAEQHGGELVLQNRDGGGLRAEIRLPGS
ncbi:sensor histidine kinase [Parerythrobacter jejuensis]|uniref:histidine kinase n=1 Tax=Parerythrobacter jejuensis TaxID=795812 RepID=A0A845AWJ2_9SPHN|nr:ATP-binding protein [Parerythrobacter jejuensis]MXP31158.1 HAMP domain-containing protein [Parerythrobacter jejuensis]MXP33918.1 HAMP domain-containing protein [Parerythrobacter jejuensis]